jgi:transcriptional regulator GlxA family with amidase domain
MNDPDNIASEPRKFGFLLLNEFTLISLSAAIEPLRMANRICERQHFTWKTLSEDGGAVAASDGLNINVDCSIASPGALEDMDLLIVCGGINIEKNFSTGIAQFLRVADRDGVALGGICTGSQVLAAAGLLDGIRCSIHWENLGAVTRTYPDVPVGRSLFTIDRCRYTSSGGTAPLDLILHIISAQLGSDISVAVAEQFICDRIRRTDDEQRIPLRHQIGSKSAKLIAAVGLMEANLREPIGQDELAAYVDLSRRQLQRLFDKYLLCSPSRYYLKLRLRRARELLLATRMSIADITAECGFISTSNFSKSYKELFGYAPSMERDRQLESNAKVLVPG